MSNSILAKDLEKSMWKEGPPESNTKTNELLVFSPNKEGTRITLFID